MQDDEIANALELDVRLRVVPLAERCEVAAERKHLDEARYPDLDEVNARAFERLHEPAGESQCHDVLVPHLASATGHVADEARLGQRRTFQVGEQLGARLILRQVRTAEDKPVADPALQRYAPLPSGAARDRARVRQDAVGRRCLYCESAVGWQPVAPVLVPGLERLLDQQAAKSRAVDEQVARHARAVLHDQRSHVPAFAVLLRAGDLAFDAPDASGLVFRAQKPGVEAGIQVVRIVDRHGLGDGELAGFRRLVLDAVLAEPAAEACRLRHEPHVVEAAHPGRLADIAEGMDIAITGTRPVLERDAQLEAGLRSPHELPLVESEQGMKRANRRDGRLAYSDSADLLRFNQRNVQQRSQLLCQGRGCRPAGRATSGDDDACRRLTVQRHAVSD